MSVNGTGLDRRTQKPLSDSTNWKVVVPGTGEVITYRTKATKEKPSKVVPAVGIDAATAFGAARQHLRSRGVFVTPVRT